MANLLLLDDGEVAGRAMRGILARGSHRCLVSPDTADARRVLREGVTFDLVIVDLRVGGSPSTAFLQTLRDDWFWRMLPIVVYTQTADARLVRECIALKVQNYLVKPYNDELIYREIEKAVKNPWRNLLFEEPKSFRTLMGITAEELTERRRGLMVLFDRAARVFPSWSKDHRNEDVFREINTLREASEAAGVWVAGDYLTCLQDYAAKGEWSVFAAAGENFDFASRLVFTQLNPSYVPDCFRDADELTAERDRAERARWDAIDIDKTGPVVSATALKAQAAALAGCPVADTAAASFQMVADGKASSLTQVMDIAGTDPGICAQVIGAANRLKLGELTVVDDAGVAVSLLGETRLLALGRGLPLAQSRHLETPTLSWPAFWMYQVAVGRLARFVCKYLEFDYLVTRAYTAGLMHDTGKLVLAHLQPHAFRAILNHCRDRRVPLAAAERKFLGCTSRELGVIVAEAGGVPEACVDVMRWIEAPDQATRNQDLVAMLALSRHICLHYAIGQSGESPRERSVTLSATPEWSVLQERLFPSFDLKRFEVQAHAFVLTLRNELSGDRSERRLTHAQRAAELV